MAQGELTPSLGPPQHVLYGSEALPVPQGQTPRLDEGMESAEDGEEKLALSKSQDVPPSTAGSLPSKQEVGKPPRRPLEFCDINPIHTFCWSALEERNCSYLRSGVAEVVLTAGGEV